MGTVKGQENRKAGPHKNIGNKYQVDLELKESDKDHLDKNKTEPQKETVQEQWQWNLLLSCSKSIISAYQWMDWDIKVMRMTSWNDKMYRRKATTNI
ncbi:hypothetical protein RRG08_007763 [Elysia crispata]|uniref:Uncharacterized protein n=1 Tax=Elysia crispata TaxID=231223 RepID=A0AAE1B457_9GAST|nr:hypothetical protein RRG08_007763 [Elysia crispata]